MLAEATQQFRKSSVQFVHAQVLRDKKFNNNLVIELDTGANLEFGFLGIDKRDHDAGYDAYITGFVFLCVGKYLEIGNILVLGQLIKQSRSKSSSVVTSESAPPRRRKEEKKGAKASPRNELEILLEDDQKRSVDFDDMSPQKLRQLVTARRDKDQIKHYSKVQNRPLSYVDLE